MFVLCRPILASFVLLLPTAAAADPAVAPAPVTAALPGGDAVEVRSHLTGWLGGAVPQVGEPLLAPVTTMRPSSGFGVRIDPIDRSWHRHDGVDLPGSIGTPVHAAADGVVAYAGHAGGYGNLVEIAHAGGVETRYAHMAQIDVGRGAVVRRGDVVGLMGSTGRSTGSHLHFEVRVDGRPADPLARFDGTGPRAAAPREPIAEHWGGFVQADADRLPSARIR